MNEKCSISNDVIEIRTTTHPVRYVVSFCYRTFEQ